MEGIVTSNLSDLEELSVRLLATLDEATFFSELGAYLKEVVKVDHLTVYRVMEDSSVKVVCIDGNEVSDGEVQKNGPASAGYVIRTKRAYFSNNVERDPIFAEEAKQGIRAELCIPIIVDGITIGTIHFQSIGDDREFGRSDITNVLAILNAIKKPLVNIKMYLSAKFLNEILLKKVEEKEKEIRERQSSLIVHTSYIVKDKKVASKSASMKQLLDLSAKAAKSDIAVLVAGETGVGKEMIAKKIHCTGDRKDRPFVGIDCSSLSPSDIEAELFGVEEDFSSKKAARQGLIEAANGGTLFINNIELLPLNVQSRMNSFFDEEMAFRIGGHIPFKSDVRLIGATCANLKESIKNHEFREDFYYTLATIQLTVPSLKERKEDIEDLASLFLNIGKKVDLQKSLSPGVVNVFLDYNWPGNIRELKNVLERAYILSEGRIIERNHLDESLITTAEDKQVEDVDQKVRYKEMTLDELEKRHICMTLEYLGGNKTKTAKLLGITVKTLYNKLHSYGMIHTSKEA